jgi:hypothetical protein
MQNISVSDPEDLTNWPPVSGFVNLNYGSEPVRNILIKGSFQKKVQYLIYYNDLLNIFLATKMSRAVSDPLVSLPDPDP